MNNINQDYIYCWKCGMKNSSDARFCTNCGNKLMTIEDNIKQTSQDIKEFVKDNKTYRYFTDNSYSENTKADFDNKDMSNYIQKNVEYYISKFKDIQEFNQSTSWNWSAFFFKSWWFLYRKMYAYGFGLIIASFIIKAIAPVSSIILNLVIAILSGLYGNIAYLKQVQNELDSVHNMNEDVKQRILISRGGVNIVIPLILAIITIGIFVLIGTLGAFLFMLAVPSYY